MKALEIRQTEWLGWLRLASPERWVLVLALLNGLLYLVLVPPWQHYDEPTHFEYAWLIASRGVLPKPGDYDQDLRREVAASMVEHRFFRGMNFTPNLLARDQPVWLGASQLGHPPLYYLWVALFLRWIPHADVTFQLYVARFASLLLYLSSVWLAGRVVAELVPAGHVLRWAVPGMMALLPAYTDLMTAVNNDVGAVMVFSLFLWGAVRMIQRGFSWPRLVWVGGGAALCLWTKNTVAVAVWMVPLVVALALLREAKQRWMWLALGVWGLLPGMLVVGWGDAAYWYRQSDQAGPTREVRAEAPLGKAVLALEMSSAVPGRRLMQPLLAGHVEALRGKEVTLGAWVWASEPVRIRSPMLNDGVREVWRPLEVGTSPAFYVVTGTVAPDARTLWVILQPSLGRTGETTITVYYDGLVLVEGIRPANRPPVFSDPEGREGVWGGASFVNRLRNGSAEASWPRVRRWMEQVFPRFLRIPADFDLFLATLLDVPWSGWVYLPTARTLLRSFWAYFGWGHVQLASPWYRLLDGLTLLGLGGAMVYGIRRWRELSPPARASAVLMLVAGLWLWTSALLRVLPYLLERPYPLLSVARYAFPGIIPTIMGLTIGWLGGLPGNVRKRGGVGLLLVLLLLDLLSISTIWSFYRPH
ncbi:ArnT family glycosyltransferase [Thermoflexus sp.]|uniref:ArnT family glycosyltransferase n=1 Tax=Thermoflexus sp. TaxID=1969742 RepID=UPI0035E41045